MEGLWTVFCGESDCSSVACCLSLVTAIFIKEVSIKVALDILSFLGASLLLLCTYMGYKYEEIDENLCTPLNSEVAEGREEFLFWFHQTWTTSLQLCLALIILFRAVGLATIASLVVIILTVLCNAPLAKLQHKFQSKLMVSTLRLVQEPVRCIPDVIGVVIQAKEESPLKPTLRNINLEVRDGEKVAICGEVSSGKSTLLAAILGEVPNIQGTTGTIRENILFGSGLDNERYQETLENCSLVKDLDLLPYGDLTDIGERGVNLSGGQKQRIQLARALHQDADIYLLDDPFSAVDAHTCSSLFNEYVMAALSTKTVLLVTHQVDFLPAFDFVLLMSDGEILQAAPYHQLLASSREFQDLVNAHKETGGAERLEEVSSSQKCETSTKEIRKTHTEEKSEGDQLIKQEEGEVGGIGLKPYMQYLNQNKVALGTQSSKSLFSQLLNSLFRVPMSFYDSTPLGRILSWVSADLSIVDPDVPFSFVYSFSSTINTYANLAVLAVVTWQVLFISIPMIYLRYYFSAVKELMRINGTTKSSVANHLVESIVGLMTIRAFGEQERFFVKNLDLIDINASPFFHCFAANEWLIERLGVLSAVVLSSSALCMVLLPPGTFSSGGWGFVGMALSYGLSLNMSLVFSIQNHCTLANLIIFVERLNQYMHIPSEAPEVIEANRPPANWPIVGKVEIQDLKIRYRPDAPIILRGITCTFEGGHKIGIVGRTGSGKSTLIGALFRLVEPAGGKIVIEEIDIFTLGLHDLRSRFGIIPQDPTLFNGTGRYNLDPLGQHTDQEKEAGLDSMGDGSNSSMGQRQLFCLGRALLRRSKILVLDEVTASIDNATDLILQRTIRIEFADCTVITVAHRIPTVMDSTMVLAISDGKLVEYDEPLKLMK
ncbi:unnamed protein product [Camellia sinensis]